MPGKYRFACTQLLKAVAGNVLAKEIGSARRSRDAPGKSTSRADLGAIELFSKSGFNESLI